MEVLTAAITLSVCLAMILFFRQTDKNSRSIEKAKKYGDKVKDEIESFVNGRMNKLQTVTFELETKMTQAIAAVNRLDTIRDDFMKKSDALSSRCVTIEKIEKTVAHAEKAVNSVMNMTGLAEKNLERVRRESDFTDALAKNITEAKTELAEISTTLAEMQKAFQKECTEELYAAKTKVVTDFETATTSFENRVSEAQHKSEKLLEITSIQLNDLYKKAFIEASQKAEKMEDTVFTALKSESADRLEQYRNVFKDKMSILEEKLEKEVSDSFTKIEEYRQNWQAEADKTESVLTAQFNTAESSFSQQLKTLQQDVARIEQESRNSQENLKNSTQQFEIDIRNKIETAAAESNRAVTELLQSTETKYVEYKKYTESLYERFEKAISNADMLAAEIEAAQSSLKEEILRQFSQHTYTMQEKYNNFEKAFSGRAEQLESKISEIAKGINLLQSESHTRLRDKLKVFENDFYTTLTRKSDTLTADIEKLRNDVGERLTLMSSESESSRKDLEDQYKHDLKQRLAQMQDEHTQYFAKLTGEVTHFKNSITKSMEENGKILASYRGQIKTQIEVGKDKVRGYMQNEFAALKTSLEDEITQQRVETEQMVKDVQYLLANVKQDADTDMQAIKHGIERWQIQINQSLTDTQTLVDQKITSYSDITECAKQELIALYEMQCKELAAKNNETVKALQQKLTELQRQITAANENITTQVHFVTDNLQTHAEKLTDSLDKTVQSATDEAARSLDTMKDMIYTLRTEVDRTRDDLFENLHKKTEHLSSVIEEIDKKQESFVKTTKVFDRADTMKAALEHNIEKLKGEVTRFEVYRDTMDDLSLQYEKVTSLEEESMQKIARFMNERKNIDLLENQFAKLSVLSESMDKKILELASANDELQHYQVQIRRIEESITDVNTRYDRLEKKGIVLDQTVQSIDEAFENLKTLEKDLKTVQEKIYDLPPEMQSIEEKVDYLIQNQEKAAKARQQLETIDGLLADMEIRIEKMHSAREWLAGTETRLQDISKNSETQLKLLSALLKAEKPSAKAEGTSNSPPAGTRENVLKLFRNGWTHEAIANALNLSQGEVELILELAEK